MPKVALELKFTCENLRELSPSYPCFRWLLKRRPLGVRVTQCSKSMKSASDEAKFDFEPKTLYGVDNPGFLVSARNSGSASQCTGCGQSTGLWHDIVEEEKFDIPSSRGRANFVCKCKLCGEQSSVDILKNSIRSYRTELNEMWQRVVVFDCRGMEPIDYNPEGGWTVMSSKSNAVYECISLDNNEWVEYDEQGKVQLSIENVEHRFIRV